jgi:hypothetical protein
MDNVQKHNNCINIPSSQTSRSWVLLKIWPTCSNRRCSHGALHIATSCLRYDWVHLFGMSVEYIWNRGRFSVGTNSLFVCLYMSVRQNPESALPVRLWHVDLRHDLQNESTTWHWRQTVPPSEELDARNNKMRISITGYKLLWNGDTLLGNDRERSSYTKAVTE